MNKQHVKIIQRICTEIYSILPIESMLLRSIIANKLYDNNITKGDIDPKSLVDENREYIINYIIDHFIKNPRKFKRPASYENQVSYYSTRTNKLIVANILTCDPIDDFNNKASGLAEALAIKEDMESGNKASGTVELSPLKNEMIFNDVNRAVIYLQAKTNTNIVVESFKSYKIPRGKMINFTDGFIVVEMAERADELLCKRLATAIYNNEQLNTKEALQVKLDKMHADANNIQVENVIKSAFIFKNNKEVSFNVC